MSEYGRGWFPIFVSSDISFSCVAPPSRPPNPILIQFPTLPPSPISHPKIPTFQHSYPLRLFPTPPHSQYPIPLHPCPPFHPSSHIHFPLLFHLPHTLQKLRKLLYNIYILPDVAYFVYFNNPTPQNNVTSNMKIIQIPYNKINNILY